MRLIGILLSVVMWLAAPVGYAEDNPERGKQLYAPCVACHGSQAEGSQSMGAPRLAHLAPVYVVAQLQKFQSGARGGSAASDSAQQMAVMAATLPDEQSMYDTAAYIASLENGVSAVTVKADLDQGASYYRQFCAACHGPAAAGNPALNSPRLAGAAVAAYIRSLENE